MNEPTTTTESDPLSNAVDVGDVLHWEDDGSPVEILGMYIGEDGVVQVRVDDAGERRTVTADDVVQLVAGGALVQDADP